MILQRQQYSEMPKLKEVEEREKGAALLLILDRRTGEEPQRSVDALYLLWLPSCHCGSSIIINNNNRMCQRTH